MTARRLAQVTAGTLGGIAAAIALGLAARQAEPPPVMWQAPEFALVGQTGDTLETADLRDAIWVGSFIFTNCDAVCPLISERMAELRDRLAASGMLGREVRLVSFSVDPARDSPEALAAYAARYGASPPSDWAFLTGSPPAAVRSMIQNGFHLTAVEPSDALHGEHYRAGYQVMHSPRLVLVDRDGGVRGTYDANEPEVVERLLEAIATLR